MAALAIIAFWVLLGLIVFGIALSGGPRAARRDVVQSHSRQGRRTAALVLSAVFLGFGVAVPAIVIAANHNNDRAGHQGIKLTAAQQRGREIFGHTCNECHTLAAANTVGRTGPNLDQLQPPKPLVLDAIAHGRARGSGRMPSQLLQGKDAQDVASFVARVAGRN